MQEKFNTPNFDEHLKKGVKPIRVCLILPARFHDVVDELTEQSKRSVQYVNFYDSVQTLADKDFLNGGHQTYVISTIDEADKFSRGFANCTSLIVAGTERSSGNNISFLTHQNPDFFLYDGTKDHFMLDIRQRLNAINGRCYDGTVDAVIVGGNDFDPDSKIKYLASIKLISEEVRNVLGFEPVVVNGPKTDFDDGKDDIFYENEHRRLYLLRPNVNFSTKDFLPSRVDDEKDRW